MPCNRFQDTRPHPTLCIRCMQRTARDRIDEVPLDNVRCSFYSLPMNDEYIASKVSFGLLLEWLFQHDDVRTIGLVLCGVAFGCVIRDAMGQI